MPCEIHRPLGTNDGFRYVAVGTEEQKGCQMAAFLFLRLQIRAKVA